MKNIILLLLVSTASFAADIIAQRDLSNCGGSVELTTSCNGENRNYHLNIDTQKCSNLNLQTINHFNLGSKIKLGNALEGYKTNITLSKSAKNEFLQSGLNVYLHSNSKKTQNGVVFEADLGLGAKCKTKNYEIISTEHLHDCDGQVELRTTCHNYRKSYHVNVESMNCSKVQIQSMNKFYNYSDTMKLDTSKKPYTGSFTLSDNARIGLSVWGLNIFTHSSSKKTKDGSIFRSHLYDGSFCY